MEAEKQCRTLAATQANLIRRDQARACGMTDSSIERRTASGLWTIVLPGIYALDTVPPTWGRNVRAALLWAGQGSALSHQSAGALWRLCPQGPVVVSTLRCLRPPPQVRVRRVRELTDADVQSLQGIAVTTPARTLLDLAAVESADAVERAVDEALRRRLVSLAKLEWYLETRGGRGRSGSALMKRLLAVRPAGSAVTDSDLEHRVWKLLTTAGLPSPTRQHPIYDGRTFVARVDLAYPDARLAVEVDGYRWHSGRQVWSHDLRRRNRLTSLGWRVLHVTHDDVERQPAAVAHQVRTMLLPRTVRAGLR